jgi:hypothetical protein
MTRRLALCCFAAAALAAQPLTRGERDRAMSHLHATRKMVLDAVAGLSEAQWTFAPAPGRWSIAQCLEHIVLTEERLFAQVTEKILHTPAAPEKATAAQREKDAQILERMMDRSQKAQAPEALLPPGAAKPAELVERFRRVRDRTIAFVNETDAPLRLHFAAGPGGEYDAYQFLLIIAGHTGRHVQQIEEIKASADFPRP